MIAMLRQAVEHALPGPSCSSGMNMSYARAAARFDTRMTRLLGTDSAVYNISLGGDYDLRTL
jgi:hypothetical protein